MKKGIVMEGGAMRGMFTAGVIDVLMENDITFDGAIGVSAGAVFGCNYKSRQIGRVIRYNTRFCDEWRFCSVKSLLRTGDMFGADFCYNKLPYELDIFDIPTYRANPMKFYVVCTDLETGWPLYKRLDLGDGDDMQYFRASASMPLASRPVELDGHKLLDGGISDSIPLKYFEKKGYEKNLVVLTQPADYVKKPTKAVAAMKVLMHKYPNMIKTMEKRHIKYNKQVEYVRQREADGDVFVIQPPEALNIKMADRDPDELRRVYEIGRQVTMEKLEELKTFLQD